MFSIQIVTVYWGLTGNQNYEMLPVAKRAWLIGRNVLSSRRLISGSCDVIFGISIISGTWLHNRVSAYVCRVDNQLIKFLRIWKQICLIRSRTVRLLSSSADGLFRSCYCGWAFELMNSRRLFCLFVSWTLRYLERSIWWLCGCVDTVGVYTG